MNHKKAGISVFFALALSGCATQEALYKDTQSGKAEQLIPGVTVDEFRNEIVLGCSRKGMEVESLNNSVTCSKPEEGGYGAAAQILMGNRFSGTPHSKVRFTFAQSGPDVFVVVDPWLEMTMGFGEIKRVPMNNNNLRNELQLGLEQAAENARKRKQLQTAVVDSSAPSPAATAPTPQAAGAAATPAAYEPDPAKRCDSCKRLGSP